METTATNLWTRLARLASIQNRWTNGGTVAALILAIVAAGVVISAVSSLKE